MNFRVVFGAFALSALTSPVFAQDAGIKSADTVLASVNDTQITLGHVITALESLPAQFKSLPDDQLFEGLVTQLIQQELLQQSMDGQEPRFQYEIDNHARQLVAGAAIAEIEQEAVTEVTLQAAYEERFEEFEPSREFNAAHILVETQEEALALIEELNGGKDFGELAKMKSTGPSGPNGGDLGWFGLGMMVAPFETATTEMSVGDISAPVQTQFGWHVIKLNDTRVSDVPPLEQVSEELAFQLREEAVRTEVVALENEATITRAEGIDPALIRNTDLLSAQ